MEREAEYPDLHELTTQQSEELAMVTFKCNFFEFRVSLKKNFFLNVRITFNHLWKLAFAKNFILFINEFNLKSQELQNLYAKVVL